MFVAGSLSLGLPFFSCFFFEDKHGIFIAGDANYVLVYHWHVIYCRLYPLSNGLLYLRIRRTMYLLNFNFLSLSTQLKPKNF